MTKDELIADLRARSACVDQVNLLAQSEWPYGDDVSVANLAVARAQGVNIAWYARRVLSRDDRATFTAADWPERYEILAATLGAI